MKKILFMMSMLLTLGLFSACSSDGEMDVIGGGEFVITDSTLIPDDGVILSPIDAIEIGFRENDVEAMGGPKGYMWKDFRFFNQELPLEESSESFFVGSDKDECYVINSLEELRNIYSGEREIPYIDFDKYTLVIGQKVMPDFYHPEYKQDLEFRNHRCDLNLYVPDYDPGFKSIQHFYYWAFYPKFNTEGINNVSFIKQKSILKHVEDITGYVWKNYLYMDYNDFNNNLDNDNGVWEKNAWDSRMIMGDAPEGTNSMHYYPINLPDDFVVDKLNGIHVKFSGDIIEMNRFSNERLSILSDVYFLYITKIEVID